MTFRKHDTLPAWQFGRKDEKGFPLRAAGAELNWFNDVPPPSIGTEIESIVNGIFPAVVDGYFEEEGYLGLRCHFTEEVKVFGRTIAAGSECHLFGPEFRMKETP